MIADGQVVALAFDARGQGSTPGHSTLELDTGYHPFKIGEM
jgi:hypothetical protein